MIPKVIYLTYKNTPPQYVFNNWKKLNPGYTIDFSLDKDCISFLVLNFDREIVNLFNSIPEGMYKADLWRLCKLYINGGIYADVDLVPYVSIDKLLETNYAFYSCLSKDNGSCFQAFIATFEKNPLILNFIFSFIQNKPYTYLNGPCYDMYHCIKENLNIKNIIPETEYILDYIKIKINIGTSITANKIINLYHFAENIKYIINLEQNPYKDTFDFEVKNNKLFVTRSDQPTGWEYNHYIILYIGTGEIINIGSSESNVKIIDTNTDISPELINLLSSPYDDAFDFKIEKNKLIITRIDTNTGWEYNHNIFVNTFKINQSIFLFTEIVENGKEIVKFNDQKIFDSRYDEYTIAKQNNKVWK